MPNQFWVEQEQIFLQAIEGVQIPNASLGNVDYIEFLTPEDFDRIPNGGGCYWIWTNENVMHSLHKNNLPTRFNNGEIIYNGIAKDDVRSRIKHHLIGEVDAGWSGISLDIYQSESISHRKKAMSSTSRSKVPNIDGTHIRTISQLLQLNLSDVERNYIQNSNQNAYYFRNGINVFDSKHKSNLFRAYFITGLQSLFLEFIEKKWREDSQCLPRLCSYSSGR